MPEGDDQALVQAVGRPETDAPDRSLGRMLRESRERQQLSIEQIAADLRIEPRLLEALEENRVADLGAPVFAKGYLKQYGQRLGLKYEDLLGRYYDQVEPQDMPIAPSPSIKLRDERQITMWLISGLALALLAVLLLVWWVSEPAGSGLFGRSAAPAQRVPGAHVSPPASASAIPVASASASASAADAPQASGAQPSATTPRPQDSATAPGEGSAAIASAAADLAGDKIQIELTYDQDSWTEITDGSGERLYYGLAREGAHSSFHAVPPVSILLGNADGVRMRVDGHDRPIPRTNRQGHVARFTVGSGPSAN